MRQEIWKKHGGKNSLSLLKGQVERLGKYEGAMESSGWRSITSAYPSERHQWNYVYMYIYLLPSRLTKCGYCKEKQRSNSTSNGGTAMSLERSVRLLLCMRAARMTEPAPAPLAAPPPASPKAPHTRRRVTRSVHSLKRENIILKW